MDALKTHQDVATAFEVSLVTVANWLRRADFPGGRQGPWEQEQVESYIKLNGLGKYFGAAQEGEDGDEGEGESLRVQKLLAEIRKLKADASGKELRNDKAAGEVIDRKDAMQGASEVLLMVKARSMELPERIGMLVPSEIRASVVAEVENEVRKWLKEMAGWRL